MQKKLIFFILILSLVFLSGWTHGFRKMGLNGRIVFSNIDGDSYLMDLPTGKIKRIPIKNPKVFFKIETPLGGAYNPVLSPDGTKIAYNNSQGLWVANIDGTEQRLLTDKGRDSSQGWIPQPIAWSPDGKLIAFTDDIVYDKSPQRGVYIIDADGKNERLFQACDRHGKIVLFFENPEWPWNEVRKALFQKISPDGKKKVFVDGGRIYIANVDGTNKICLTPCKEEKKESGYWDPRWSPEGKKIFCWTQVKGQRCRKYYYFMMMNPDGSGKTRLKRFSYWFF